MYVNDDLTIFSVTNLHSNPSEIVVEQYFFKGIYFNSVKTKSILEQRDINVRYSILIPRDKIKIDLNSILEKTECFLCSGIVEEVKTYDEILSDINIFPVLVWDDFTNMPIKYFKILV